MRGLQGIAIAVGLGIIGAVCNWFYITKQASSFVKVSFVAISQDSQINPGDKFKESHFVKVDIPESNQGNLDEVAVLWRDLPTVIGEVSNRPYRGGEILLQNDLQTPPQRNISEELGEGEVLRWVPVDQRTFAPDHINPGDMVMFDVSTPGRGAQGNNARTTVTSTTQFGPFEILTLGNRRGKKEILKSRGGSVGQENLIGIRIEEKGKSGDEAGRLFDAMKRTGSQGVQVILLSARRADEKTSKGDPLDK